MTRDEFTQRLQTLTPQPRSVLILLLRGLTDREIATKLKTSPATIRKHVQNLCDHFGIEREVAGLRRNRRKDLIAIALQEKSELLSDDPALAILEGSSGLDSPYHFEVGFNGAGHSDSAGKLRQDWGEAPDASVFYGRTEELSRLQQWIVTDHCHLVALLGMRGIGKTALSVRVAQQLQEEFEYVIWRSVRHCPPLGDLLANWLRILSPSARGDIPVSVNDRLSRLMDYLRSRRCLFILDNWESLLCAQEVAGDYQDGFEGYGELLRRMAESNHQSCLILTSSEKPREIGLFADTNLPVRVLSVRDLPTSAAREILKEKGLVEEEAWDELIQLYRGNPLALKIVATTILDLFAGKASEFLQQNTVFLGKLNKVLEEEINRLSQLEMQILSQLVSAQNSVSLVQLREVLDSTIPTSQLIEALESLLWRSLIEKNIERYSTVFKLQPVIREYLTHRLQKQQC